MCPNYDVDSALPEKVENFLLFALRPEPAEHFDPHWIFEHALAEDFEVLLGEHRRRREHGDLPSVHHGFERAADCHFGLSKTDIAADEAIHRPRALHVDLGV